MRHFTLFQINKNSVSTIFLFKIIIVLLLISNIGFSQGARIHFGISAASSITGSGFGIQYSPGVFCKFGNKNIEIGAIIQKRNFNASGVRVNYEYTVFDGENLQYGEEGNRNLELFFFSTIIYEHAAKLSSAQIRLERKVSRAESAKEYDKFEFNAIEAYEGFGLRIKLSNRLKWVNSIGVGGWKTFFGERSLDREYNSVGLFLRTSLSYQFGK